MRDAGYKETRIFTPEAERLGRGDDDDATVVEDKRLSAMKDGVGAVVGFLAGLIPGATGCKTGSPNNESIIGSQTTASPLECSPPVSPLANRFPSRSVVNLAETARQYPEIVIQPTATPRHSSPTHPHTSIKDRRNISPVSPFTSADIAIPRPSRATAYLRHIASVPSMPVAPQRPQSTPVHLKRSVLKQHKSDPEQMFRYDKRHTEQPPPLPKSWLEMATNAVLFGGEGAHIGRPNSYTRDVRSSSKTRQGLRPSRSSLSQTSYMRSPRHHSHLSHPKGSPMTRNVFTDQKSLAVPQPPALFAQIERGRAGKCANEVCLTRVVCRSAPGSRAGSIARSGPVPVSGVGLGAEKRKKRARDTDAERGRERGRARSRVGWLGKKGNDRLRVPSLARTWAEGDIWSSNTKTKTTKPDGVTQSVLDKSISGYYSEGELAHRPGLEYYGEGLFADQYADIDDEDDEDEDEEGEVNLARMLLPPKRQNSIRSLRKHLLALDSAGKAADSARITHGSSHLPSGLVRCISQTTSRATSPLGRRDDVHKTERLRKGIEEGEQVNDMYHQFYRIPLVLGSHWKLSSEYQGSLRHRNVDDEDAESFAGFFGVDPMGSGRSRNSTASGKSRLGIANMWSVIGGGSS